MLKLAEQHVMSLNPYVPGRSIENDSTIVSWAKLASNENCLGPSPHAIRAAAQSLSLSHRYPNAKRLMVIDKICEHFYQYDIKPKHVALGNGGSEIIVNLVRGVLGSSEAILFGWPSFVMYRMAARAHGRRDIAVPLIDDFSYDVDSMIKAIKDPSDVSVKLVIIANPNNPTGAYLTKAELDHFMSEVPPDVIVVIDEAYGEYVDKNDFPNGLEYALARPRTLVLRTFSKVYGLAGLRLGFAMGDPDVVSVLGRINDPFNVNSVVQDAAVAALDDREHVRKSVMHNLKTRPLLAQGLKEFGFTVYDSVANFLMIKGNAMMPCADNICRGLMAQGIVIRKLDDFGAEHFLRISVGTINEINQLFNGLRAIL